MCSLLKSKFYKNYYRILYLIREGFLDFPGSLGKKTIIMNGNTKRA